MTEKLRSDDGKKTTSKSSECLDVFSDYHQVTDRQCSLKNTNDIANDLKQETKLNLSPTINYHNDLIDREIMCCSVALVAHWAARVQMPKIFRRCSAFHLFPHACPDFGTSFSSRHWRAAAGPSRPSRSAVRRVPPPDFWVLESTGRENNIIQFLTQ